jgi:hypothetical protein
MRGIQHCINALREAQSKRIILFRSIIIPDAQKGEALCVLRPLLLLETNKVEWKHSTLSGLTLEKNLYNIMMDWTYY